VLVNGGWSPVFGSSANTATHTVAGAIFAPGVFMVAGSEVKTVVIGGPLLGGAVYAGQTRSLTAATLAAAGDTAHGVTVAWSTSDPALATVDAAGNVTGKAAGTVTVTAAAGTVEASTPVTVLPRPVAAWSQVEEWSTLQGNGRHDGHVAATLDVSAFHLLWTSKVTDQPLMRAAATGAGKVFVSTGFGPSPQTLSALDAATGAVSWSRVFPSVSSVTTPAFGNGRVYVVAGTGGTDARTLWSLDAGSGAVRFETPYADYQSLGPPAVVTDEGVYTGGLARRFDAFSGAETYHVDHPWYDGDVPAVADGRLLVYGIDGVHDGSGITVLNAATGAISYTVPDVQAARRAPVVGGAGNVLGVIAAGLQSTPLQPGGAGWTAGGAFTGMPAVGSGVVAVLREQALVAYRESDGALLWTWTFPAGQQGAVPPLVTDNLVFVSFWYFVPGPGGSVQRYVTYAIDRASGKQVWSYAAGGYLALSAGGTLVITSPSDGTVTAIAVK